MGGSFAPDVEDAAVMKVLIIFVRASRYFARALACHVD